MSAASSWGRERDGERGTEVRISDSRAPSIPPRLCDVSDHAHLWPCEIPAVEHREAAPATRCHDRHARLRNWRVLPMPSVVGGRMLGSWP